MILRPKRSGIAAILITENWFGVNSIAVFYLHAEMTPHFFNLFILYQIVDYESTAILIFQHSLAAILFYANIHLQIYSVLAAITTGPRCHYLRV